MMKKMMTIMFMIVMMAGFALGASIKLYPVDDSYTDISHSNSVFNNQYLKSGNDANFGKHRTFLKFDLSSIQGEINNARLSIDPLGPTGTPELELYYISSDSWSENSLTWNNQPSFGNLIDSEIVDGPERFEFDVLSMVNEQDNILSLGIKSLQENTVNIYVQMFSSEYQAGGGGSGDNFYWPYLELNYEPGNGEECNTQADSNCDGCVSLLEMVNLMLQYKQGQTSLSLLEIVNLMLQYKQGGITC